MSHYSARVVFPENMNTMLPITIKDDRLSMTAAFVGRYAIEHLPDEWRKLGTNGFYVLLSELRPDYSFEAYVGQTRTLFELRLNDHDEKRAFWKEAILFTKFGEGGLTSTQVNWLEGEIVRLLRQGRHIRVHNKAWTGDTSLPEEEEMLVEDISLFVMRALFLRGYRSESLGKEVRKLEDSVQQHSNSSARVEQLSAPTAPTTTTAPDMLHITANPEADIVPNDLWETLRRWRWRVKGEANLYKAYNVCKDVDLAEIQELCPTMASQLHAIEGLGATKIARFGPSLIATLNAYYALEQEQQVLDLATELPAKRKGWFGR